MNLPRAEGEVTSFALGWREEDDSKEITSAGACGVGLHLPSINEEFVEVDLAEASDPYGVFARFEITGVVHYV